VYSELLIESENVKGSPVL